MSAKLALAASPSSAPFAAKNAAVRFSSVRSKFTGLYTRRTRICWRLLPQLLALISTTDADATANNQSHGWRA